MSGSNLRLVARSVIINCVLEVVMIELLYCGDSLPQGLYVTIWIAIILGGGLKFVVPCISILLMYAIEFPFIRLFQFTILP